MGSHGGRAHVQTEVWQHGGFEAVPKGECDVMELQQGVKALFLCCTLHSCVQAYRNRRDHGPQCLDQQHRHHLVRVLEYLFVNVRTKRVNPSL